MWFLNSIIKQLYFCFLSDIFLHFVKNASLCTFIVTFQNNLFDYISGKKYVKVNYKLDKNLTVLSHECIWKVCYAQPVNIEANLFYNETSFLIFQINDE